MINTLTLNPAIDKILYLNELVKNVTCRTQDSTIAIGGKGTHVSINLKILGEDSRAFGICHGNTGKKVVQMLKNHGVHAEFIHHDDNDTRTNYLIIEEVNNNCTIIAEKGVTLSLEDVKPLVARMKEVIRPGDYMIFSGDASNCTDPKVYNYILDQLKDKNLKVFLDTSGYSLRQCIQCKPYLIKPNLDELSFLCGYSIPENDEDIILAIDSLDPYQVDIIAVSLGSNGSIVKTPEGIYKATPPKVAVCNTIGCGDCFLAGFIHGISEGLSTEGVIRMATAVSSATAESALSVGYELQRAIALQPLVKIKKLR